MLKSNVERLNHCQEIKEHKKVMLHKNVQKLCVCKHVLC